MLWYLANYGPIFSLSFTLSLFIAGSFPHREFCPYPKACPLLSPPPPSPNAIPQCDGIDLKVHSCFHNAVSVRRQQRPTAIPCLQPQLSNPLTMNIQPLLLFLLQTQLTPSSSMTAPTRFTTPTGSREIQQTAQLNLC